MAYPQNAGLLNPMLADLMARGQQPLIHPTGIGSLAPPAQRPAGPAQPGAQPSPADIPADPDAAAPVSQAPMDLSASAPEAAGSGAGFLHGLDPDMLAALMG